MEKPPMTKKAKGNTDNHLGIGILQAELLPQNQGGWCQLLPAGRFQAVDGRPHDVKGQHWQLNEITAFKLIDLMAALKNNRVIDYEHQTLKAEENGQPAPAAGWFNHTETQWRPGKGLFIKPRWTSKALAHIEAEEYKYLSAVFSYDKTTGEPIQLKMAALVNYPGIDGMEEVAALAALQFGLPCQEPMSAEVLYSLVAEQLGITIEGNQPTPQEHQWVLNAIRALKQKAASGTPQYVSKESYDAVMSELASLRNTRRLLPIHSQINAGIREGKLFEREREWLTGLAQQKGVAVLSQLIEERSALIESQARLSRQTLTSEEELVIKTCNIDRTQYLKSKNYH